ncbi:MAG: glutathione S-transferase family protein [Alphaproteobacteria bacterium]|nr:glutathione S-transferase family protein [Alphaproteobacteria bacterium]
MAKTAKKAAKKGAGGSKAPAKKTPAAKAARPLAKRISKPVSKKQVKTSPAKSPSAKRPAPKAARKPIPLAPDPQRFTLYGSMLSGPTYTVGLMLSLCKYPFSYIHVNLREGQHKQPDYLVKNRYGQVPSLRDGQSYYVQSAAIIEHLAESLGKFDGKTPYEWHRIREWLFWQWDKLALPIFRLRARVRGLRQFGDEVRTMYDTEARAALAVLENELGRSDWVAAKRPTVADIGCYAVIRYAPEANIDLTPYPHVGEWKKRFEALPGFGTPEQILPMESRLL